MDSITYKQIKYKKSFFTFLIFLGFVGFASPAFGKEVDSSTELSIADKRKLVHATQRFSNHELYSSNLEEIAHPSIESLLKEAKLKDTESLNENYQTLVSWYSSKLSKEEKAELSQRCENILNGFNVYFPMTETTLSCAGWWLDQKIAQRLAAQNPVKLKSKSYFALSAKDKYNWYKYRNLSLYSALRNMQTTEFSNVEKLAKTALTTKYPCSYKNANFALIATLEDFFPKKEAYQYISKIYKKSEKCYQPNADLTERINLRVGVIHLVHGNYTAANHALQKNKREKKPNDESRSLFWLGMIAQKQNKTKDQNQYWNSLIKKNPFGFFSLVANTRMNQDPITRFVPDKNIKLQNRIPGGWNELNVQSFLFDLFYIKDEKTAIQALSNAVVNSQKTHKNLDLYWAVSHSIAENDRYSIVRLASYLGQQKTPHLSKELVKLNFPMRYSKEILKRSKKVDPLLVLALIRQESAFDPRAKSIANARGLMQMLPSTAKTLKHSISAEKLFDPQTNINLGVTYLESLFERYDGRTEYVLAAYNAGPHRVDDWSARISTDPLLFMEYVPYKETRNYVSTIMRNYYWYKYLTSSQDATQEARRLLDRNMSALWKPNQIIAAMNEVK